MSKIVQGHQARKRFGQNFLAEPYYINRIVDSIAPQPQDQMVEIGPGLGAITELLLDKVASLNVVELDRDLIPRLQTKFADANNFQIHHCDALKFDFASLVNSENKQKLRIVGNLPYNISTPLIFHLLQYKTHIQDMYFMLQREVVERICAEPSTKAYGRLSVMSQYHCETQMLFTVPPGAFQPAPKVNSAIVRLMPRSIQPLKPVKEQLLAKVVTESFNQRRKTIRNNLKHWLCETDFELLKIEPSARPETLTVEDYLTLTNLIENKL